MVEQFFQGQSGKLGARAREVAVNPDAPACSPSFDTAIWCPNDHLSELRLSLPHNLLNKKRFH